MSTRRPHRIVAFRACALAALAVISLLAGYGHASAQPRPQPPPPRPTATPAATAAPTAATARRPRVRIPVRTARGRRFVQAEVRQGIAVYQGDIDLGDPEDAVDRSLGLSDRDLRWRGAVVPYTIAGLSAADAATMRSAMDHIERRTQIRFVAKPAPFGAPFTCPDHLLIIPSTDPGKSTSKVGRRGGCQHLRFWHEHGRGVAIHELGHALGLKHEQSRPDRDSWIQVLWQNIDDDEEDNFEKVDDEDALDEISPYDFDSVMHYGRWSFCVRVPVATPTGPNWQCAGPTMRAHADPDRNFGGDELSKRDVNLLSLMYGKPLGANESGDRVGAAVALADFDQDGHTDVVMGAPGERVGDGARSGALFAFKGTSAEPAPWTVLTEETPRDDGTTVARNEENDELGAALLVADFDDDGFPDLAAGAPNKAPGGGPRSGGVMFYRGTTRGLVASHFLHLGDLGRTGAAGDRFGASLATIRIGNSSRPHLVVGAPGRGDNGAVYVVLMGFIVLGADRPSAELLPYPSPAGARFGAALAAADFDGDGDRDLVVGAPGWGPNRAGSFTLFLADASAGLARAFTRHLNVPSPSPAAGDEFGFALAASNVVAGDGRNELVVGAPGKRQGNVATGAAFVYRLQTGGQVQAWGLVDEVRPGSTTDAQRFGHAFGAGRLVGDDNVAELVVGAPGFEGAAGRVVILRPSGGRYSRVREVSAQAVVPRPGFGSAIATGVLSVWHGGVPNAEVTAPPTLFVGAPGAALAPGEAAAGVVYGFNNGDNASLLRVRLHQARSTPWSED